MRIGRRKLIGKQTGVTLLELVVVMAVSGLLVAGIWRVFQGSVRFYQRGMQDVRSTMAARTVFGIMTRDVQQAFAAAQPGGIQETASRQGRAADTLELTVMPSPRAAASTTAAVEAAGWPHIRYALQPGPHGAVSSLARTFMAADGRAEARVMPLSERLTAFRLRYFDGGEWSDVWQQAALPRAVEITAVFRHPNQERRTHRFTTVVTAP